MNSRLHKNILSTLIYYDILDYPMTAFEVWKYLMGQDLKFENQDEEGETLEGVMKELDGEELRRYIDEFRGFYFLKGREKLVGQRLERNKISERKFKIIRRVVFWLRFVPYVRMIMVTGRVAQKNARRKSDLDLLVVLKKSRIFTGRLLVTLVTQILGKRRHGRKITDRVCLNYFITDASLEIDIKDIFSSHEYFFGMPVFGGSVFREFQKANGWIRKERPNFSPEDVLDLKIAKDSPMSKSIRSWGEKILDFDSLERRLKKWQMGRIANDPRTYKKGSGVSASSSSLVFLPDPQGPEIYERYRRRLDALGGSATM